MEIVLKWDLCWRASKWELFELLAYHGTPYIVANGVRSVLLGILREDGSGDSFLLQVAVPNQPQQNIHVRAV